MPDGVSKVKKIVQVLKVTIVYFTLKAMRIFLTELQHKPQSHC